MPLLLHSPPRHGWLQPLPHLNSPRNSHTCAATSFRHSCSCICRATRQLLPPPHSQGMSLIPLFSLNFYLLTLLLHPHHTQLPRPRDSHTCTATSTSSHTPTVKRYVAHTFLFFYLMTPSLHLPCHLHDSTQQPQWPRHPRDSHAYTTTTPTQQPQLTLTPRCQRYVVYCLFLSFFLTNDPIPAFATSPTTAPAQPSNLNSPTHHQRTPCHDITHQQRTAHHQQAPPTNAVPPTSLAVPHHYPSPTYPATPTLPHIAGSLQRQMHHNSTFTLFFSLLFSNIISSHTTPHQSIPRFLSN